MRALALAIGFSLFLARWGDSTAETWVVDQPEHLSWYSADSMFRFDTHAGKWVARDSLCPSFAELSRKEAGEYESVWKAPLFTEALPELAVVSQDGKRVAVVGNHFQQYGGDHLIVVYGEDGSDLAHLALRDIIVKSPANAALSVGTMEEVDSSHYFCFYWGCVSKCLVDGTLEMKVAETSDIEKDGHCALYPVNVQLESGKVVSDVAVFGRPLPPTNQGVLNLLDDRALEYPEHFTVDRIMVDARREKCFFLSAQYKNRAGQLFVDLLRIDTTGSVAWRESWETTLEQRPMITVSDTIVFVVTKEKEPGEATGRIATRVRVRAFGHAGAALADWQIDQTEIVGVGESDRWLAILGRDIGADWPQVNTLRLYNADGSETDRLPGFANPSGATRMAFLNQDTLLVSFPDDAIQAVTRSGQRTMGPWRGYYLQAMGLRSSSSYLVAYGESSHMLYNLHVYSIKGIAHVDSIFAPNPLTISGCYVTRWTEECVAFGRTTAPLGDFDGYAVKFRPDGAIRWEYALGTPGYESIAAVLEPVPRRVIFLVLESEQARVVVCEQAYR